MRRLILLISALMAVGFAPHISAQTVDPSALEKLRADEKAAKDRAAKLAKQQDAIRKDISKYKRDLQSTAREASVYEATSSDIARRLDALELTERELQSALTADRAALTEFIAALQRIEANPPPIASLQASDMKDATITAQLIASISKQLQSRADDLRARMSALSETRTNISRERETLSANESALQKKRNRIKKLVGEKTKRDAALGESRASEKRKAEALAAKASDLADLISQFERSAKDIIPRIKPDPEAKPRATTRPRPGARASVPLKLPDGSVRFAKAKGALVAPVQGRITQGYGKGRQGLTVSTRAGAQVLSPYYGRVEFAGAFKTYGQVVILNVGDNYFLLLTGLGEIFASSGETVERGEPVGLMPFNAQNKNALYIELRKSGRTINPTPWLGKLFE